MSYLIGEKKMGKKKNLIVLIIMEIIIVLFTIMVFVTPLMKRNINFEKLYTYDEKKTFREYY